MIQDLHTKKRRDSRPSFSMFVSIARQLVVLLPVAYLLSKTGNLNMIWWAFPIAEMASVVLCVIFLKRIYYNVIKDI